ncbi:MAG: hypothetical protein EOO38_03930 [Cytophagaceae bacterium]|nr:MAG: hypothetical protein EOO38_03930 [Cytophagaceae bacterium]
MAPGAQATGEVFSAAAEAKVCEGSLSGMDEFLGRYLREAYTLYEALQVILNEPIYQELLFRVPEDTEDAKLSIENVRLLICFFCVLLLDGLRTTWVGITSSAVFRNK